MPNQATPQLEKPSIQSLWLPLVVGLVLCIFACGMWQMLEQQESANRKDKIEAESDFLGSRVESDLKNRIPDLQRMVKSWELRQGTPKDEFITEAQSYLSDVPGFQALEWVDKDGHELRRAGQNPSGGHNARPRRLYERQRPPWA